MPQPPTNADATDRRDLALQRITRVNRWLVGGAVALTVIFTDVAAHAFAGRTTAASPAGRRPAVRQAPPRRARRGVRGLDRVRRARRAEPTPGDGHRPERARHLRRLVMAPALATVGGRADWYLTRATGVVCLVLLTLVVVLGVLDVRRFTPSGMPRFVVGSLHREHRAPGDRVPRPARPRVGARRYASISLADAVIPFHGTYRPILARARRRRLGPARGHRPHEPAAAQGRPPRLARGALARLRLLARGPAARPRHGQRREKPLAAGHRRRVRPHRAAGAMSWRALDGWPSRRRLRSAAMGAAVAFPLGLLAWLPERDPLGPGWAQRSGTPASLLGGGHAASAATTASSSPESGE